MYSVSGYRCLWWIHTVLLHCYSNLGCKMVVRNAHCCVYHIGESVTNVSLLELLLYSCTTFVTCIYTMGHKSQLTFVCNFVKNRQISCYTALWKLYRKCIWTLGNSCYMQELHWQFHKMFWWIIIIFQSSLASEWTFITKHVFKLSTTSAHTWSQTVMPLVSRNADNVLFISRPSLHRTCSQVIDVMDFCFMHALLHTPNKAQILVHFDEAFSLLKNQTVKMMLKFMDF